MQADNGNDAGEKTGFETIAWPRNAAAAEQALTQIEAFVGDDEHPIPELRLLRIAIWTRLAMAHSVLVTLPCRTARYDRMRGHGGTVGQIVRPRPRCRRHRQGMGRGQRLRR